VDQESKITSIWYVCWYVSTCTIYSCCGLHTYHQRTSHIHIITTNIAALLQRQGEAT
jgi:hypothetical protein